MSKVKDQKLKYCCCVLLALNKYSHADLFKLLQVKIDVSDFVKGSGLIFVVG